MKIDIEVEVVVEVGVEIEVCVYTTQSVAEYGRARQSFAGQGRAGCYVLYLETLIIAVVAYIVQ